MNGLIIYVNEQLEKRLDHYVINTHRSRIQVRAWSFHAFTMVAFRASLVTSMFNSSSNTGANADNILR